jgi:Uncharacterised nucleotidyltransferase
MSSNPDLTILSACMRYYLHTATAREVTRLLTPDLDWENLVQTAISQGVMPLLYQSLKEISLLESGTNDAELVPKAVIVQLHYLNRMNGLHNFAQTKELLKLLAQLERAGIETIAFKGPVLAASVYGNVALRQFGDLDILVRYRDFWQAKAVLENEGYQSSGTFTKDEIREDILPFHLYLQVTLSQNAPESMMFNRRFQSSLLHSNSSRSIDLHWGIPPRRVWNPARFDRLWDNLNSIDLMGKTIKTCSPEATLVIQCLNVAKTPWEKSLKQICDVVQIGRSHPDLDWHLALQLSSELRSQRSFLIGLRMTRDRLNVPLPQFILDKLIESQPTDEKIAKSYDKCAWDVPYLWFQYTHQLRTSDRGWDRLFITGIYLQWLLVITISPSPLDREFVAIPHNLDFLYYLIRPMRLLIQYLPFRRSVAISPKL